MRTEEQIVAELWAAKAAYHESAQTLPRAESRALAHRVKELTRELSDFITESAVDCPNCGNRPHGIHQVGYYEIGCLYCTNEEGEPIRSRGFTRNQAVLAWNAGEYFTRKDK
jgi:hypothetical protein